VLPVMKTIAMATPVRCPLRRLRRNLNENATCSTDHAVANGSAERRHHNRTILEEAH
jgi:hypothetical protein